jgi:hypothetical protein
VCVCVCVCVYIPVTLPHEGELLVLAPRLFIDQPVDVLCVCVCVCVCVCCEGVKGCVCVDEIEEKESFRLIYNIYVCVCV